MTATTEEPTGNSPSSSSPILRPGVRADSYAVFKVFEETLADLSRRLGSTTSTSWQDPAALARMWEERRPLYEHLADSADHFWVAEQEGQVFGFARSVLRDGLRQLTEMFVAPGRQSGGVGRRLMARVFPSDGVDYLSIIASSDIRAQALYLRAGVYPRFPVYYFGRAPEPVTVETDLVIEPMSLSPKTLAILGELDERLLEFRRDVDHTWLLTERQGYLYYRDGAPVGYGYSGVRNGPFALLEGQDFPAVLAHAERSAAENGRDEFGVEAPMINQAAVDYLLARDFRLDSFSTIFMSNKPFGSFDHYILTSPPFFM